jgi:AAA ATPase domain
MGRSGVGGSKTVLHDRRRECAAIDSLLGTARTGQSGVLVVRGEAGAGKSALLGYASEAAAGFRVARACGVESEMELAFAGLQQLCAPLLDGLERLPAPQRDAIEIPTWPVSPVRVSRSGTIEISTRPERQIIWSTTSGRITGRFFRHLGSSTRPTARTRS